MFALLRATGVILRGKCMQLLPQVKRIYHDNSIHNLG